MSSRDLAAPPRRVIAITGGTGYLGRPVVALLLERGHRARLLTRPESVGKLLSGVEAVRGSALSPEDITSILKGADTLVHLVGVPKPNPSKARQFRDVDLASVEAAVAAAKEQEPRPHFVYVSVAQPAPVMKAYVRVREEGERLIRRSGFVATFLRPWYVLGPGHRWPIVLLPIYALLRQIPATREGALRLGFVTLAQMAAAIVAAVEAPPTGVRVIEVPEIARSSL